MRIPRAKIRKTLKWGSTALAIVIIGAWIASAWWYASWLSAESNGIRVSGGQVWISRGFTFEGPQVIGVVRVGSRPRNDFRWWDWEVAFGNGFDWRARFPIWLLALPPLLTATITWRLDRRNPKGTCPNCSYNRTGLTAATVCPECGNPPETPA